jgi:hypothetical protein
MMAAQAEIKFHISASGKKRDHVDGRDMPYPAGPPESPGNLIASIDDAVILRKQQIIMFQRFR